MSLFLIKRKNEELVEFYVNGELVGNANHDEHGWSGIEATTSLFESIARTVGAELLESDEQEIDEE